MTQGAMTWRFPRMFWTGNSAELCERAAYYGTFIALRTYLIRVVGLDDVQAGVVAGPLFSGPIYLVPFFDICNHSLWNFDIYFQFGTCGK